MLYERPVCTYTAANVIDLYEARRYLIDKRRLKLIEAKIKMRILFYFGGKAATIKIVTVYIRAI